MRWPLATIWRPSERRLSKSGTRPRILVVNQTVNSPFCTWLETLAREHGTVVLLSGNAPARLGPGLVVHQGPAYDRTSVRSRLWSWVQFTAWATWKLLWIDRQVPVFVVTNPPPMPLAALLLYAVQGRRFGLLEWDIYPQVLEAAGVLGSRHVLYRLWRLWHGRALRDADLVIAIGDRMADVLRQMSGEPSREVAVLPNWVDTDWIRPLTREENIFAERQGLQDGLLVIYSGNLGVTHAIETIVRVAEELADEQEIIFLVVGEGAKRSFVEEAIAAGRVPNLRLLHRQPAASFPEMLASAQVGIVTLADGYEDQSMPSKTYDLMAAGTAILGVSNPPNDLAMTIERHGCGVNFSPGSVAAIADWLRGMAADADSLNRLRCASRQAAVEHYGTTVVPAKLTERVRTGLLA
jgi:glycosyltransferase involved in cell wall biosynthesis